MKRRTIGGFLSWLALMAACNGDTSGGAGGATTDPFIGTWACSNQRTVNFTMPAGVGTRTETSDSTRKIAAEGGGLVASDESDGAPPCKVAFTSDGTTATLSPGQTCMRSESLTLTYKSGSATVSGNTMNSTFEFDATGTVSSGGMMVPAVASGSQTSTCSRISAPPTTTGTGGEKPTGGGGW
jgi:hypothetical protein